MKALNQIYTNLWKIIFFEISNMQNIVRLQYGWFLVCDFSQSMKCSSVEIFKCSSVCEKQLNCGKHFCKEICHEGPCDPCTEVIKQGKRSQPFILKGRRKQFQYIGRSAMFSVKNVYIKLDYPVDWFLNWDPLENNQN